MGEFKYKSRFESKCSAQITTSSFLESKASLEELKSLESLISNKQEVVDNPDLLYIVFNAAVVNLVNLNGDAIATETAVSIIDKFKNKPVNIEHCSSDVIGYISNSGFSSFPDNQILAKENVSGSEPFNISLSAIVWKTIHPYLCDMLCESNEEDGWCFKDFSTSWEIGFNEFDIAVGSKNLSKARIISDPQEVESEKKYLRCMGGTGFNANNEEVYLVIKGNAVPLGVAITTNPAAAVKGISVVSSEDCEDCCEVETEDEEDDMEMESSAIEQNSDPIIDSLIVSQQKILEKISQLENYTVKANNSNMKKIQTVDDLYDMLSSASEAERPSPRDIVSFIREQISALNEKFVAEQSAKANKEAELTEALDSKNALAAQLTSIQDELSSLRQSIAEKESKDLLDARLSKLDDDYELTAQARKLIIKSIANLSDEDYQAWLSEDGAVILSGKEKKSTASTESTPEQIVSNASVTNTTFPNTSEMTPSSNKLSAKLVTVSKNKYGEFVISTK